MSLDGCTLMYFGVPARAEAIRLALTIGGVTFNDDHVVGGKWADMKMTTPFGKLPVLLLANGTQIGQQRAILRFVGRSTGLYPQDSLAAAMVDGVMDAVDDVRSLSGQSTHGIAASSLGTA